MTEPFFLSFPLSHDTSRDAQVNTVTPIGEGETRGDGNRDERSADSSEEGGKMRPCVTISIEPWNSISIKAGHNAGCASLSLAGLVTRSFLEVFVSPVIRVRHGEVDAMKGLNVFFLVCFSLFTTCYLHHFLRVQLSFHIVNVFTVFPIGNIRISECGHSETIMKHILHLKWFSWTKPVRI